MDCGLYIHFPWCASRCTYCDFNTWVADRIPRERYTAAILQEGRHRAIGFSGHRLTSIYFGGGTPSLWGAAGVRAVIEAAHAWFPARADGLEITLECNPAEAAPAALEELRAAGVNRLSLGVQSLDDALLRGLGRRHDGKGARAAVHAALEAGFDSCSADLMFGLPGQSLGRWIADLEEIAATGMPHLSVYHLTLEPGTAMTRDVRAGRTQVPSDDDQADMWEALEPTLEPFGLRVYEISNAARAGHEARHNTHYWTGHPYLGLGAGAHSLALPGGGVAALRTSSQKHHLAYMEEVERAGHATAMREQLDPPTHLRERLFTGLRRLNGLSLATVASEVGLDPRVELEKPLHRLIGRDLLRLDGDRLALTPRGVRFADDVFVELF